MTRFFAFLRAINVGGHTVKMDHLCRLFESMGLANVETFIASGNVVFEATHGDSSTLEARIEAELGESLGYGVATFIRTGAELGEIAKCRPYSPADLDGSGALNIAFMADSLDSGGLARLMGLRTPIDDFRVQGREIYWRCLRKQSESKISNAVLEKALGRRLTLRGASTLGRMAAKYGSSIPT